MKDKKKILLIEDEHDLRLLYCDVLMNAGYLVDNVADGTVGLDRVLNTDWDLLLLDIMLPGQDGLKILKQISMNKANKKGPVLVITNFGSEYIIKEAFRYGADGFMLKADSTPGKILVEIARLLKIEKT